MDAQNDPAQYDILMFSYTAYRANVMLKHDGFSVLERLQMNLKGLPWLFGRNGTLTRMGPQYRDWFKKTSILVSIRLLRNMMSG